MIEDVTLLDKATLMFFYCQPEPPLDMDNDQQRRSLRRLLDAGLIVAADCSVKTTERATVLCEALRNVPLPVQTWVIPVTKIR